MSFILEALKKSENKRRKKSVSRPSRSIHEPVPRSNTKSRLLILGIFFVLLVNIVFLFWLFSPWTQSASTMAEVSVTESIQPQTNNSAPASIQMSSSTSQVNSEPASVVPQPQPKERKEQSRVTALPAPRSEKKIYSFDQLPVSIQKQIPALHMSLHAYNRNDATASMVQLNNQMMHEKEMVNPDISLEQITAEGVVLHYDGYRFLLPRRGN
ncbi:MAG: general secretion pathway protein GspB [Desulfuromusa sp.]|jgi:general secretion pathway protein B|nr:general secretion pathway protein GspB [Desulfuromusa sp.]